jgi:Holliday junction DNA helicase RuvA
MEVAPSMVGGPEQDVIDALIGLGYNEEEAEWAAREARHSASGELKTEEWIKKALQQMMTK